MSEQPTAGGREPDASTVSPLLGTNRLQQGIDRFSGVLDKASDALGKAAAKIAQVGNTAQRGTVGNPSTLGGGRPLGGGATFSGQGQRQSNAGNGGHPLGMPGWGPPNGPAGNPWGLSPQGSGPGRMSPKAAKWSRYGEYAGAAYGGYTMAKLLSGADTMMSTNTTAQLMSRSSSMGAFDIRSALTTGNPTALNSTDAMAGGANLLRSGYSIGSSGFNMLNNLSKNYRIMDPTASSADATARLTSFAGVGTGNFLLTRGIRTRDARGGLANPISTADSIIAQAGYSQNKKWTSQGYQAQWGAGGNAERLISSLAETDPQMAQMVRDRLQGRMQASMHGMSVDAYTKAVASNDWNTLSRYGIKKTDIDTQRDVNAKKMDIEDNTAQGFSKGLQTANAALEQFYGALDAITHGPLGDLLGAGKGAAGASGALTSALDMGASVGGSMLGGALAGRVARTGVKATAGAVGRGALGAGRSALGAFGAGGALRTGAVATGLGASLAGGVILNAGAAGFNTVFSDDERHSRKAQLQAQGQGDFWSTVNSWSETFNNNFLFGLPDAIGANNSKGGQGGVFTEGNGGGPSTGGSKTGASAATSGIAPVSGFKISAPYGHYSNGKPHHGVDFACPIGTPVKANRSGKVIKAGWDNGGFGNHVRIDSGDGLIEIYGHMSRVNVKVGDTIHAGQLLGLSGDTGNVTGPHLHFEVRKGGAGIGNAVDPMPYLNSSGGVTPGTPANVAGSVAAGGNAQSKSSMSGQQGASSGVPWGVNEAELVASGLASTPGGPGGSSSGDAPSSGSTGAASTPASGATGPLRGILAKAGFSGSGLAMAYAIMMAESHGNSHAHNTNARTGDNSYGLFQINMLGGMGPERRALYHLANNDALFDPLTNAKVAFQMSGGGKNWTPWSTYKRGDYKQYLGGNNKSYDVGSTNIDVDQTARVHKGEMILDPVTSDELRKALSTNTPTSVFGGKGRGGIHIDKIEISTAQPFTASAATDLAKQFLAIVEQNEQMQLLREG